MKPVGFGCRSLLQSANFRLWWHGFTSGKKNFATDVTPARSRSVTDLLESSLGGVCTLGRSL
jgi:hypothetical protein